MKKDPNKTYSPNWGGYRGQKRGVTRTSFSISCQPEELERVHKIIEKSGKTQSRFVLDLIFAQEEKE